MSPVDLASLSAIEHALFVLGFVAGIFATYCLQATVRWIVFTCDRLWSRPFFAKDSHGR